MADSQARQIHGQAAKAREDGDSVRALQLALEALEAYQKEDDTVGFAEIHAEMFLTLRHLYEKTNYEGYLVSAKHVAMAGAELAQKSGNKEALAIPLFNLAKAQ